MLLKAPQSALLIIDVQTRLAPFIHQIDSVLQNCIWLAGVATRLEVPTVVTEHFPDKLGATADELKAVTTSAHYVEKKYFSAWADGALRDTKVAEREQIIMCGTEAHVCVQQTAIDLAALGKQVAIVHEASGSRKELDRDLAFERMRSYGIRIVSREMVAFEWLERGGTDDFREVCRDFIR